MYAHPRPGVILNGETDGHFGQNFVPIEQHLVRIVPIWLFYVILDQMTIHSGGINVKKFQGKCNIVSSNLTYT